jgi:hypothetical protein
MTPLSLKALSANAYRVLGLTANASQADIDLAARQMRIWQDPELIPPTPNDAEWIGPVPRSSTDIENAVARLADPLSRLDERFWWFCQTPPESDQPPQIDRSDVLQIHDAALIHLYRSLLGDISGDNLKAWQKVVGRFRYLATSDDYLQWLLQIESNGDFEKPASLDEIAMAQQHMPDRLSSALAGSVQEALESGDFVAARKAVQLVGNDQTSNAANDELVDRMEEDLAGRCAQLREKIDQAWETRRIALLRPACNHVINRFGAVIHPLIGQLVCSTSDVDRHNRARMLGVELLMHTAKAYEAFENFLASERTLETAYQLALDTPMASVVLNLQEKARLAAERQRMGVAAGHRNVPGRQFKIKQGGPVNDGVSWISAIPFRVIWVAIVIAMGIGRMACSMDHSSNAPASSSPHGGGSNNSPLGN